MGKKLQELLEVEKQKQKRIGEIVDNAVSGMADAQITLTSVVMHTNPEQTEQVQNAIEALTSAVNILQTSFKPELDVYNEGVTQY